MTTSAEPLVFNPFDPAFRTNPYPTLRRFLHEDPWHASPLGMTVLSRYDDCVALLRHPSSSTGGPAELDDTMATMRRGAGIPEDLQPFLFMDPPNHTRLRGLVQKAFTPRVVETLRPRVQQIVDGILDRALEAGEIEAIEELAYPVPVQVISEMIGVPNEDHDQFKGWSRILAKSLDPEIFLPPEVIEARQTAIRAFVEYFRALIAARRGDPRDDLLTALIQAEEAGDKLSEGELLGTLILLLIAGHETTVNLIGNGLLTLCRLPDAQKRWRADPSLDRSATDEVLRYDPPVQFTARFAPEAIDLPGGRIEEGAGAIVLIGAANRDPSHFADPETFDPARADNHHLAFGFGIHHCIGASLAKVEGQIALGSVLRRTSDIALADDNPPYKENVILRGLAALPLTLNR